jgi:DNA-binding MarR family transcriptional regulator
MAISDAKIKEFRSKLRIMEREIARELEMECCGISLSQCHALVEIKELKETTIKHLSEILDLDKSTLSRTIDGMLNVGLVNREIDKKDRRYMKLSLTDQGNKIASFINQKCDDYYKKLFEHIPAKEHDGIIKAIDLIGSAMNKLRKNGVNCCN